MKGNIITAILLASVVLSGCRSVAEIPQGAASSISPVTEETVSTAEEAETVSSVTSAADTAVETTAGTTADSENTEIDFPEEFYDGLAEIAEKYPHFGYYDISLAYYDIETGFSLMINPDNHYYSASVMKAPYMLYIYRLALEGEADIEEKIVYTEEFKREGTGILKDAEFETEYTIEELIGFTLEESDNAAFAMLRKRFPEKGYVEFIKELGIAHDDDSKAFNKPQICCETALIFSQAIHDFIAEENPYSENLRYHMTHSRNAMIYGGSGAEVVRKYGWYEGYFHDMAVVYGEKDYFLTIMTNLDLLEIEKREYDIFRDLSRLIAEYSTELHEADGIGRTKKIELPRMEVKDMNLPKDPYMLLSVVNMKLRDIYSNFDELCEDMDADAAEITAAMEKLGYVYDAELNQFAPIPEEEPQE